jgi:hypothetical protein
MLRNTLEAFEELRAIQQLEYFSGCPRPRLSGDHAEGWLAG